MNNINSEPDQFTVFPIRSTNRVVTALHKYVDAHPNDRVHYLTDRIINEYVDLHSDDKMLTCYIGENKGIKNIDPYWTEEKRYNLQIRNSTLGKLRVMAEDFNEPVGTIAKIALRIWLMQNS